MNHIQTALADGTMYRFALFYHSTKTPGGRVDFDYYRVGQSGNSL